MSSTTTTNYSHITPSEVCYLVYNYLLTISPNAANVLYNDAKPLIDMIQTKDNKTVKTLIYILNEYVTLKTKQNIDNTANKTTVNNNIVHDLLNQMKQLNNTLRQQQTLITQQQHKLEHAQLLQEQQLNVSNANLHNTQQQQQQQHNVSNALTNSDNHINNVIQPTIPATVSTKRKRKSSPHKITRRSVSNDNIDNAADHSSSHTMLLPPRESLRTLLSSSSGNTNVTTQHTDSIGINNNNSTSNNHITGEQLLMDPAGFHALLAGEYPEFLAQMINQQTQKHKHNKNNNINNNTADTDINHNNTVMNRDDELLIDKLNDSIGEISELILNLPQSRPYIDNAFSVVVQEDSNDNDIDVDIDSSSNDSDEYDVDNVTGFRNDSDNDDDKIRRSNNNR